MNILGVILFHCFHSIIEPGFIYVHNLSKLSFFFTILQYHLWVLSPDIATKIKNTLLLPHVLNIALEYLEGHHHMLQWLLLMSFQKYFPQKYAVKLPVSWTIVSMYNAFSPNKIPAIGPYHLIAIINLLSGKLTVMFLWIAIGTLWPMIQ